jgi:hypothetical protein
VTLFDELIGALKWFNKSHGLEQTTNKCGFLSLPSQGFAGAFDVFDTWPKYCTQNTMIIPKIIKN